MLAVIQPLLALAIGVLASLPSFAQEPAPIDYAAIRLQKVVAAVRVTESITLDGRLDEPAWKLAIPATDFMQYQPFHGQPSGERSEVRFIYDDDNLYIGFICFDSQADKMVVNDVKEDFNFNGTDGIGVLIDSLHDRRSGFLFGTNPAGAKRDSQVTNDNQFGDDWDSVWDVKVSRNDEGWIAEYMIPFKTLRFSDSPSQEWGLNMNRRILRLNEESMWSPYPIRFRMSRISTGGTLKGIENIRQGLNLRIKPFVTAEFTQTARRSTQWSGDYDGGVDLKYSITPSLTFDGTYRTDFAQVEVDQQQVNLTRFNLFFPEKRDFFLENAGTFAFGAGGNAGNLVPFFSRRIGLSADGTPIPIIGGARASGQLNRYDIGVLTMKTERQGATPSSNYAVGRIKRNLMTSSWVGALITSRNSTTRGDHNRVYGADARFQLDKLDFDAYILKSDTPGRGGKNQAKRFVTAWRDDEVTASAGYNSVEANFNPELGFVRRGNMTEYSGSFAYNPLLRSNATIRNLRFDAGVNYVAGASSGEIETRTQSAGTGILFQNSGSIGFEVEETFDRLKRSERILGINIPAGDYSYRSYSASATSDQRRRIGGNGNVTWGEFWNGTRKSFGGGLTVRPNYRLNIAMNYSHNRVALGSGRATTDLLGTRLVYGFSPRAFFNAFVQYNAANNRLSSNIRFNWLHHPLSDLYFVYNDTRDTHNGTLVERAFIIKFTNLFNF